MDINQYIIVLFFTACDYWSQIFVINFENICKYKMKFQILGQS